MATAALLVSEPTDALTLVLADASPALSAMNLRAPLRFVFSGYSVWLELEERRTPDFFTPSVAVNTSNDLTSAIRTASVELGVYAIPSPHVTVVYGISHLSEAQVLDRFQRLKDHPQLLSWPALQYKKLISDVEIDGVNGGSMDMAWMEITHETSDIHEELVDLVYDTFHGTEGEDRIGHVRRSRPWAPHTSLAYDNPENGPIPMAYLESLVNRFPTLQCERKVTGIGLWRTTGKIDQWELLDRISVNTRETANV